jgi:hypothetical protein
LTRIRKLLLLGVLALAAPVFLVACGDENSDLDPKQVLIDTFTNDEKVTSGTIDLSLSGSLEGTPSGSGEASISGPFQGDPDDENSLPQFDFTASLSGDAQTPTGDASVSFDGGLTATEDNMYVEYQGTTYELGSDLYGQFRDIVEQAAAQAQAGATGADGATAAEAFDQQCASLLEMVGGSDAACETIDVWSWFELTNEGTEEVEGADTVHIHGEVDIPGMIENVNAAIEASDIEGAEPITDDDASQIEDAVESITFDVYSGVEDDLLRGFDLAVDINGAAIPTEDLGEGESIDSISGEFSSRIGGVNEEQTIEAPADAQPLEDLLGQFGLSEADVNSILEGYTSQFGLGALGGGLGATGAGGSLGGGAAAGGGGGGGSIDDAYFNCIAESKAANPFEECEQFLE